MANRKKMPTDEVVSDRETAAHTAPKTKSTAKSKLSSGSRSTAKSKTASGSKSTAKRKTASGTKSTPKAKSAAEQKTTPKIQAEENNPNMQVVPVSEVHTETNETQRAEQKERGTGQDGQLPVFADASRQVQTSGGVPIHFPEEEKRSFIGRALCLLILLAVVAVSVLIFLFRPSEYTDRTDSVNFFYVPDRHATVIAVNGTVRGEVGGALSYKTYDGTGRVCAAILDGKLYLIQGRRVEEIATDVTDCVLSSNGRYLAWRNGKNELYYSAVNKKDHTYRISGNCTDDRYCLSPDGKEMLYTYTGDDGILRMDAYSGSGSKPYLTSNENFYPVAVSDKCRFVYYTDGEGALYVLNTQKGKRQKCGDRPDLDSLIFNRSCSELLLYNKKGSDEESAMETRIFRNGENVVLPDIASTDTLQLVANQRVAVREQRVGTQFLVETLFDNYYVYYADSTVKLIYLERKKGQGKVTDVAFVDSAEAVTVTDKSVFFLQTAQGNATHTNLYRCKTGKTEVESLQWDVQDFCANVDGSRILYVDVHGALYSLRIGAMPKIMYDSIVVEKGICVTADDAFYFYREEGKLCVSDNGEAPREIQDGANAAFVDGGTLFYVTDVTEEGRYTVYANYRNRRKDTQIATGVSGIG